MEIPSTVVFVPQIKAGINAREFLIFLFSRHSLISVDLYLSFLSDRHNSNASTCPLYSPHYPPCQDNSSIYYEPVPDADMLDPLPEPVIMMKLLESREDAILTRMLSFKAAEASSGGGKGEGGGGSSSSGRSEHEVGASGKTDEEIARELHEKLNT